jgi:hypothetical protein
MLNHKEINEIPMFFIVGRGRSGTTLLQTILDANPNVAVPLESKLIIHLKKKYVGITNWTEGIIDEFINDLYKEKEFASRWNVDKKLLRQKINAIPLQEINFRILCKLTYLSYVSIFEKQNIDLIGDKKPMYSIFLKDIIKIFPDAKFIHIIRDYRDNIVSNRTSFLHKNIARLAFAWKVFNKIIDKEKQKIPHQFYTIRYEDLASFPEKYTLEICDFLSIKFHPKMLDFHIKINQINDLVKPEAIERLHSNMLNPINTNKINKWEKELTKSEIELADFITGSYAKKYGYQSPPTVRKIGYYVKAFFGICGYTYDHLVFKIYYNMPFFIRNTSGYISNKLYIWFKYTHYYNSEDYKK